MYTLLFDSSYHLLFDSSTAKHQDTRVLLFQRDLFN